MLGSLVRTRLLTRHPLKTLLVPLLICAHEQSLISFTRVGSVVEEMWNGVQASLSRRTQELEECVGLWTSYEENMLHVMSCLTKGEMVLAEVKTNPASTKDVLENVLDLIEVGMKS